MEKWWIYTGLAFFVVGTIVLLIMVTQRLRPSSVKKTDEKEEDAYDLKKMAGKVWGVISNPAVFLAIGIAILNWLVWALHKDFWNSFHNNSSRFWAMNLATWFAMILFFVKPEYRPVARKVSIAIIALLIAILGSEVWGFNKKNLSSFSPFTNFGQPDLLRLTPEEHKATHDTLMKTPFAERKVLWALYECDPENESFRPDEKGQLPALATYRSKGVQAFGEACVEKLTRARKTFVLAVVEATSEKWSDPVILPEALGYDIVYSSKDKRHRTTVLGPEGQEMELAEGYTVPPFRTVGAKFKARAGTVRVTVEYRPTKGASSQ